MTMVLTGCADESNKVETPSGTNAEYGTVETYKGDVPTEEYQLDKQQEEITEEKTIDGVSIDFDYMRMSGKASNQFAVWIEDTEGNVVKTIYATDFTAERRGYSNREDALSHWVKAAEPDNMDETDIDAISGATPQSGHQHFEWDLTDDEGQKVSDGKYSVKLEGTLFWSSNVIYTGIFSTEESRVSDLEVITERSEPDSTENEKMIQNVRMTIMTENKSIADNTSNWLGGLEPEDALNYMKEHYDEGLVIVEVNTDYWKLEKGFAGAMHIPHDQMADRYDEIPSGVPVILHCGAGVVSVPAYETLMKKRKDIPQLSYIAGHPPVDEFNKWLEEREK
jgi:rhodanese-related sulfurtransferase